MADKDFTSLLGRDSNVSFADIAGAYLSGGRKKDNRARNVLLATLFFNAKEADMQSKVMKNLEENQRQKTFDNAQVTNRWNAYNSLMDEDEAFKKDPNYFKLKAETEFSRLNPNFDLSTQSSRDARNQEILDYEQALKNLHMEKLKTGNVGKRLSKEEFFKPFEDYYISESRKIAAPENVSLVHKGFNFFTGNKKEKLTEKQIKERREAATRSSFEYLLNPDEIKDKASIELYRDPNQFTYNKDEAASYIIQTYGDNTLSSNIIREIQDDTSEGFTINDLKGKVLTTKINENEITLRNEIKKYQTEFNIKYVRDNNLRNVTDINQKDENYLKERQAYVDLKSGLGDEEVNKARLLIEQLKQTEDPKLKAVINKKIDDLSVGTLDRMILSNVIQLTTPGTLQYEELMRLQIGEGKNYPTMNDYITAAISQSYDNLESAKAARP